MCTAPTVQINAPYAATMCLKGFVDRTYDSSEVTARQFDPGLELVLKLFSPHSLEQLRILIGDSENPATRLFLDQFDAYRDRTEAAVSYLQGKRRDLTEQITGFDFFPKSPNGAIMAHVAIPEKWVELSEEDKATYIAHVHLLDIINLYRSFADNRFDLTQYGSRLAYSASTFDKLFAALQAAPTMIDDALRQIIETHLDRDQPDLVCISAPFPGTVYSALRIGALAKKRGISVALGGGYINTELRKLDDPRVFDFVDYVAYDAGEMPLASIVEHLRGARQKYDLFKCAYCSDNKVEMSTGSPPKIDTDFKAMRPSYDGIDPTQYLAMMENLNPIYRLWSQYYWNRLTLAQGCYWRKCTFCDTSLDYIHSYKMGDAQILVDDIEHLVRQTGSHRFHFVDEAAPPVLLRRLCEELLRRNLKIEWWTNIRFDKSFDADLTKLMRQAGCVAVTGGLEVASPRILQLMKKGITVEQAALVARTFRDAGIWVHAYLMYGFPSQTAQETVDALDAVRQMFLNDCLQSAFWHRFVLTSHSPVAKNPQDYGIRIVDEPQPLGRQFARYVLRYEEAGAFNHERFGTGLNNALSNYLHGRELDRPAHTWFTFSAPQAKMPANMIKDALKQSLEK